MDPRNFTQYVHVDEELLFGDDQLARPGEESGLPRHGWIHN